jgi:tetratricopeptide (TPR) repeat protein
LRRGWPQGKRREVLAQSGPSGGRALGHDGSRVTVAEYYERLAHHYCQTANQDKALQYLELANQKATKANAMLEAMAYFERAIAILESIGETEANRRRRVSLIVNQWIVFWLLLRVPEYYDLLTRNRDAATALSEPGLLARFQLNFGHCQWVFGLFDQASETMTDAAKLYEAAGSDVDAGPAYCMLQWIHLCLGNLEQAVSWQERALERLAQRFDLRWYAWSFAAASWAHSCMGHCVEALQQAEREAVVAEEYHDNSLVAFANWNAALAHTYNGDVSKAIKRAETAVEKAPTPADKLWAQTHLGFAWCRGHRARDGADLLASLTPMYAATRFALGQMMATTYLGEAYWRAGQHAAAQDTLQKGLELATANGMKFYAGCMRRLLGEVALALNPEQVIEPLAASHFEAGISILHDIKAENELACAYAGYGRFHKQQGREAEARHYFTRAVEIFDRLGTVIEPAVRSELAEPTASD